MYGGSEIVASKVASLRDSLINPGIEAALSELGERYTLAVATSKPRAFAVPLLQALGLDRHFAHIAGPELDAHMEPKAATVRTALDHVGEPAAMIGDRSHDVVGARANGIPVIGVTWGIGDAQELHVYRFEVELVPQPAKITQLQFALGQNQRIVLTWGEAT